MQLSRQGIVHALALFPCEEAELSTVKAWLKCERAQLNPSLITRAHEKPSVVPFTNMV